MMLAASVTGTNRPWLLRTFVTEIQNPNHGCVSSAARYCLAMRRFVNTALLIVLLTVTVSVQAATGRVIKVLPHYLDLKGRHSLSPSLYDRDAYQAQLRKHPELRSGLRLDVEWRGRAPAGTTLKLRAELRGTAKGDLPSETTLETSVKIGRSGVASGWAKLPLTGDDYVKFGDVTAWRVTIWDGDQLLGEQKSFLW